MRKLDVSFDDCVVLDDCNGDPEPSTHTNTQAQIDHYVLKKNLYELAQNYNKCSISVPDLGITILLLNFAKYYSRAQYHLFIDECYNVTELDSFESKLLRCNNSYILLPKDLPINSKYGLMAQQNKFVNKGAMSIESFERFFFTIHKIDIEIENFIKFCIPFHMSIVETLYLFASFSSQTSLILECRSLRLKALPYKFDKVKLVHEYTGCAWFVLPKIFVWFAHQNGRVKTSRYITRSTEKRITDSLTRVAEHLILGVVINDIVYPLKIEDPQFNGKWEMTNAFIINNGFISLYHFNTVPIYKRSYFVTDNVNVFYKMSN